MLHMGFFACKFFTLVGHCEGNPRSTLPLKRRGGIAMAIPELVSVSHQGSSVLPSDKTVSLSSLLVKTCMEDTIYSSFSPNILSPQTEQKWNLRSDCECPSPSNHFKEYPLKQWWLVPKMRRRAKASPDTSFPFTSNLLQVLFLYGGPKWSQRITTYIAA